MQSQGIEFKYRAIYNLISSSSDTSFHLNSYSQIKIAIQNIAALYHNQHFANILSTDTGHGETIQQS